MAEAVSSKEKLMAEFERMAANIGWQMLNLHSKNIKDMVELDIQVEQGMTVIILTFKKSWFVIFGPQIPSNRPSDEKNFQNKIKSKP